MLGIWAIRGAPLASAPSAVLCPYCDTESNRYIGALMSGQVTRWSFIATLRGSSRLAALVLALFVANFFSTVACASHDLADAGIGQYQSHMPAPADSDSPLTGGGTPVGHGAGHCAHSGGHYPTDVSSLAVFAPVATTVGMAPTNEPGYQSALDQRALRPPIL